MNKKGIIEQIIKTQSVLCVGLDPVREKVPEFLIESFPETWTFEFCKRIVDATAKYCVAYKPNLAFFEAEGIMGLQALIQIAKYIKENYPEKFLIADGKRGDIGNTSEAYAKAWLENLPFDALTVAPYMGEDSVKQFLLPNKWVILLALTSNKGSEDFQKQSMWNGKPLYKNVILTSQRWATEEQMMYVVGATNGKEMAETRTLAPKHLLLVPGVGAQGAKTEDVFEHCVTKEGLVIINSSRGIIYASDGKDFAEAAGGAARDEQQKMAVLLEKKGII